MLKRNDRLANWVIERDRNVCQCCYSTAEESLTAHHIHWIVDGGTDEANNMITLCVPCHALVPFDPDDFYAYQKSRGAGGKILFAEFCQVYPSDYPIGKICEEFEQCIIENCCYFYAKKDALPKKAKGRWSKTKAS